VGVIFTNSDADNFIGIRFIGIYHKYWINKNSGIALLGKRLAAANRTDMTDLLIRTRSIPKMATR